MVGVVSPSIAAVVRVVTPVGLCIRLVFPLMALMTVSGELRGNLHVLQRTDKSKRIFLATICMSKTESRLASFCRLRVETTDASAVNFDKLCW